MNRHSKSDILRYTLIIVAASWAVLALPACRDTSSESHSSTLESVLVTSPTAGKVSRLLVSEGVQVNAGAPIIELVIDSTGAPISTPAPNSETIAVDSVQSADREVDSARSEVVRNEANVQRLTPLVAGGEASQAELDGA